jgi:integrase
MANLRGGTFEKQVKDAWHRLERFGEGRHGRDDHATHSLAVGEKRAMYLRDFARYAQEIGFDGKLNHAMGDRDIVEGFLHDRLEGLARSTQEDYVAGLSSMMKGLREANVSIGKGGDAAIERVREMVRELAPGERREDRAIDQAEAVIAKMAERDFPSSVVAQVQHETGFRVSEALRLVANPGQYLEDGIVQGMVGKGNHVYDGKELSPDLVDKLHRVDRAPGYDRYVGQLRAATGDPRVVPHDWRYTYAKEQMEHRLANGMDYRQALREVSRELNHHREDVTEHYLRGA